MKNKKTSILGIILGIIVYSLNEGLRFGRGIDYNNYFYTYEDIIAEKSPDFEPLFVLFVKFSGWLGLSWQTFVFFMSLFFIFSVFFILRGFKDSASWALAILPFYSMFAENIMRQAFAFSFLLIGLYFLLFGEKYKYVYYIIFSILGTLIHFAIFPLVILFLGVFELKSKILKPIYSISAFVFFSFIGSLDFFKDIITNGWMVLSLFSNRFAYMAESLDYFSDGGVASDEIISVTQSAVFIVLLYYGYKVVHRNQEQYNFCYNLFVIGALAYPLLFTNELLYRYVLMLIFFAFIVFGCIVTDRIQKRKKRVSKVPTISISLTLLFLTHINLVRTYITPVFENPYTCMYVWDSGNMKVLDPELFKGNSSKK